MRTQQDIKALLVSLLPAGSEQLYDLDNTAFIGGSLNALAGALVDTTTSSIEQLALEVNPSTIVEDVPDWESACGLANSLLAKFGTIDQRRNAVLAVLRSHGSFSIPDIQAAVQPYLLYADPSQIQVLEPDRSALVAAHLYANGTDLVAGGADTSASSTITVLDDPRVSPAGAQVFITVTGILDEISFRLTAPDGTFKDWPPGFLGTGSVTGQLYNLYAKELAGSKILGNWTFSLTTGPSGGASLPDGWSLFVEGLGVNYDNLGNRVGQGLGAAWFEWAVVADPTLLGTGFDLDAAYQTLQHIKPAHTVANLVIKNSVMGGGICAIPDVPTTIPDRCVPCT